MAEVCDMYTALVNEVSSFRKALNLLKAEVKSTSATSSQLTVRKQNILLQQAT